MRGSGDFTTEEVILVESLDDDLFDGSGRGASDTPRLGSRVLSWLSAVGVLALLLAVPTPTVPDVRENAMPLRAVACAAGNCTLDVPREAQLAGLRTLLGRTFNMGGSELRDEKDALCEVSAVASDGKRVVTIRAARLERSGRAAVSGWLTRAAPGVVSHPGVDSLTLRGVTTVASTRDQWVFEISALAPNGPGDTPGLFDVVRQIVVADVVAG